MAFTVKDYLRHFAQAGKKISDLRDLIIPSEGGGTNYFVDSVDGSDTSSGLAWDHALATIQAAITKSNATINWSYTPKHYNRIYVKAGVYAENLTPPYYCWIVGMGMRGTDTAAEIHPTTGSCIAGTFLGTGLINLRLEVNQQDTPILDLGICNNSHIEDCEFTLGANVSGVAAIDTETATHLVVKDCDFSSGQLQELAYAAYHRGGADKFAHNVRYLNNRIFARTCGIYVDQLCTASQMLVKENFIYVHGTGKGIDGYGGGADTGGVLMAVRNEIIVAGAGDAIHGLAAGYKLFNMTNVNGTYAQETA